MKTIQFTDRFGNVLGSATLTDEGTIESDTADIDALVADFSGWGRTPDEFIERFSDYNSGYLVGKLVSDE